MYLDVCRFNPTAGGTTDFVYSSAVPGYQSPTTAGAMDSAPYYYRAESADLSQWEVGIGTWSVGSTTLARTTILFNSLGTTAKINFSTVPQVGIVALAEGLREKLTANRTYFVRSDGNDNNSGLVNTAAGAFLTHQRAYNVICSSLDLGGQTAIIQTGNVATFTNPVILNQIWTGGGSVILDLGGATLNVAGNHAIQCSAPLPGTFTAQNGTITAPAATAILHAGSGIIAIGAGITFGAVSTYHMEATAPGAFINANGVSYTISGGGAAHVLASVAGSYIQIEGATATLSANVTFSVGFVQGARLGYIQADSYSVVLAGHTVTGPRYWVGSNAVVFTNGGGANFFPGSSAGSSTNEGGGLYI